MRYTLIDLSSLAYPIWHMAGSDANENAVSDQLVARVRALADDHTAICCDSGKSFRNEVSADYKANRKPEDRAVLYHQIALALDRLREDGFPIWTIPGFEADDLIASAVTYVPPQDDVLIVSADKDLLQLVQDGAPDIGRVVVKSLKTGNELDEAAVYERFGVSPSQMRDYLTIVGDVSDNIKGVAGIGEKGAAALLGAFDSLDYIYEHLDDLMASKDIKPSQVIALKAFAPRLAEVRTLITLRTDAPVPFEDVVTPRTPKDVPPMEDVPPMTEEAPPPDDIDEALPTVPPVSTTTPTMPATPPASTTAPAPTQMSVLPVNGHEVEWKAQLEPRSMSEAITLSTHAFHSKQFSAYGTPQAVLMSLMAGREMGLAAMASLRAIQIIDGKPTMAADLMRALVLRSGAAAYFRCVARTDTHSTWETQRGDDPPMSLTFTMDDARQAGVVRPGSGWARFPADMLVARASSKLARLVYPDILHGVYLPEELRENP